MVTYSKPNLFRTVILFWGPALIVMTAIFFASSQPKIRPPAEPHGVYFSGAMPIFTGDWDTLIKKSAHALVYGLLAACLLRALLAQGKMPGEALSLTLLLTLTFAVTDELHQALVPGRSSSVRDIGLDYLGAILACLLARPVFRLKQVKQKKGGLPVH